MSLHIGILQTDSVLEHLQGEYGDYPKMFMDLFSSVDPEARFTNYVVQDTMPKTVECDAYIVTGSRLSVYDDEPWIFALAEFIAEALNQNKKLIGICFGHQLMAHFFGGVVAPPDAGWAVGVHTSQVESRPWMSAGVENLSLLSSHKDQVRQLPENADLFATNAFCPIAGFTMADQVITIQGHPEFNKNYAQALMTHRQAILGEQVFSKGLSSLTTPIDSQTFAQWAVAFVNQSGGADAAEKTWQARWPATPAAESEA